MLLNTRDTLAEYVSVNKGLDDDTLLPYVRDTERAFIIPALGQDLYDRLDANVNDEDSTGDDTTLNALLPIVQEPLALLSMEAMVPESVVQLNDSGAQVVWTETHRPATAQQIGDKTESLRLRGMRALDALYLYLEKTNPTVNTTSGEKWKGTPAGQWFNDTLCRTTAEFTEHVSINGSRTTLIDLRPAMKRAQDMDIAPEIGKVFFASLIARLQERDEEDSSSDSAGEVMLDTAIALLRPALANLAIARAQEVSFRYVNGGLISSRLERNANNVVRTDEAQLVANMRRQCETMGKAYLASAHTWMDEHHAELPGYDSDGNYRDNTSDLPDAETRIHDADGIVGV